MTAIDYGHQRTGAAFLAERRFALLADEPGLGKSRQAVMAADLLGIQRVLVVCPGAVRRSWEIEFGRWQQIARPIVVEEGYLERPPAAGGVTVVSHAALSHPGSARCLLAGGPYGLAVVDESHAFRHFQAARTRILLGPGGLASLSDRVWMLSGTPVVNSAADLYPMVFGAIGSAVPWLDFCRHYCEIKFDPYSGEKPVGVRNAAELAGGLRPYVLRRTMESLGIDLPPLEMRDVRLPINPAAIDEVMALLAGIKWTPETLAAAMEERSDLRDESLSRVRKALGIAKADAAAIHVAGLLREGVGPVVAFFQHTDVRTVMHRALAASGAACSWIDGKVTAAQLRAAREWFQAGRLDVLLVQTDAGGQGLTLHRSNRAVVAEMPWTSAALFQAAKRIHRIGQERPCVADVLLADGCWLDAAMAATVQVKERASGELMSLLTSSC